MKIPNGILKIGGLLLLAGLAAPGTWAQAPAFGTPATFLPSGAPAPEPPQSTDTLYLDWVSPLQAPRGLALPPSNPNARSSGAADPPPWRGQAATRIPAPTAVPEPGSAALLAIGLLPAAALLRRRR